MGKAQERQKRLMDILKVRGFVSIKELAAMLEVSEMTIRRDIKVLEASNITENVDGTLVFNPAHLGLHTGSQYILPVEAGRHNEQKAKIGHYAAGMVSLGETIVIDTGTTTEHVVPFLPIDKKLTVLCYNVNILMELRRNPGVNMLFAGGHYHQNTQMFASAQGVEFIKGIRAQKVFVSAAGVHQKLGVTCANAYEVPTKHAILSTAVQKILVADSTKFGCVRSEYFCELDDLDDVVTDSGLSQEWRNIITEKGINLHIV